MRDLTKDLARSPAAPNVEEHENFLKLTWEDGAIAVIAIEDEGTTANWLSLTSPSRHRKLYEQLCDTVPQILKRHGFRRMLMSPQDSRSLKILLMHGKWEPHSPTQWVWWL